LLSAAAAASATQSHVKFHLLSDGTAAAAGINSLAHTRNQSQLIGSLLPLVSDPFSKTLRRNNKTILSARATTAVA
jgi:hypothetical protein